MVAAVAAARTERPVDIVFFAFEMQITRHRSLSVYLINSTLFDAAARVRFVRAQARIGITKQTPETIAGAYIMKISRKYGYRNTCHVEFNGDDNEVRLRSSRTIRPSTSSAPQETRHHISLWILLSVKYDGRDADVSLSAYFTMSSD